jgi:hypothetical protein
VGFTKRTEDPKLAWLECQLALKGIPSRRAGFSYHAPILQVQHRHEEAADAILRRVDDMPDDHPRFLRMEGCPADLAQRLRTGGEYQEREHVEKLARRLVRKAPLLARRLRRVARGG